MDKLYFAWILTFLASGIEAAPLTTENPEYKIEQEATSVPGGSLESNSYANTNKSVENLKDQVNEDWNLRTVSSSAGIGTPSNNDTVGYHHQQTNDTPNHMITEAITEATAYITLNLSDARFHRILEENLNSTLVNWTNTEKDAGRDATIRSASPIYERTTHMTEFEQSDNLTNVDIQVGAKPSNHVVSQLINEARNATEYTGAEGLEPDASSALPKSDGSKPLDSFTHLRKESEDQSASSNNADIIITVPEMKTVFAKIHVDSPFSQQKEVTKDTLSSNEIRGFTKWAKGEAGKKAIQVDLQNYYRAFKLSSFE